LKHRFLAYWATQKPKNVFASPGDSSLELAKVAFCSGHKAKNEFEWQDYPLKYRYLDIAQVEFCAGQKAKIAFLDLLDL
jgi:hypothetical protein